MKPDDIARLPFMISRKTFLVVSGLPKGTFDELVKSGQIRRFVAARKDRRLPKGLYFRADLERIVLGV